MSKIGYLRVSTNSQNLDRQYDSLVATCEAIFEEKVSGIDIRRPELDRMMQYVRCGDVLYVESISRLARSTRDLLRIVDVLRAKGVGLVSLKEKIDTETAQGRFILQVFAALSELERESIKERQKEGIEAAKRRGKHLGRPHTPIPSNFNSVVNEWKCGRMKAVEARRKLGLAHATFYSMVKNNFTNERRTSIDI